MNIIQQLCPLCRVGLESYALDPRSVCPYLACYTDGSCKYFVPLEDSNAKDTPEDGNQK